MQNSFIRQTLSGIWHLVLDLRVFLVFVGVVYAVAFSHYPAAPGHNPVYPLGWWGWFDQGEYLKSAQAFAAFDFTPGKHFCPPLYSMLGAFFVRFTDPFWFVDLVCLLWFAAVFALFASRYVPRWAALLLFFLTIVANHRMLETFIVPWTTTLAVALLSTGIYALVRLHENFGSVIRKHSFPSPVNAFFLSCALGLLMPLRPLDISLGVLLLLAWFVGTRELLILENQIQRIRKILVALIAGFLVGPLFYFVFNWKIFGSFRSDYVEDSLSNGYFPADLGEKFISIFIDGYTLYLEPGSGIIDHYPWVVLVFPALIYIAVRGDWLLRLLAFAVCVQFGLYLPYGDLLPTGVWRYMNINYFKWTFPYLALFAWYAIASLLRDWRTQRSKAIAWTVAFVIVGALLLSLRLQVSQRPIETVLLPNIENGQTQQRLSFENPYAKLDLIDLSGLGGEFTDVYFGAHGLWLDGLKMRHVRDYRVLPAPWGIRILFIRPVAAHSISFQPDGRLVRAKTPLSATAGRYRFTLGVPKPFWDEGQAISGPAYSMGTVISAAESGNAGPYLLKGWGMSDASGRWSVDKRAMLRLRVAPVQNQPINLHLRLSAYVNDIHPEQRVEVSANGKPARQIRFLASAGGAQPHEEIIPVSIGPDGDLSLLLRTPDSAPPTTPISGADGRKLGVKLDSFWLTN